MSRNNICPPCNVDECFACENGLCLILTSNDFGKRECPFFKTAEQVEREQEYCEMRMAVIKNKEE